MPLAAALTATTVAGLSAAGATANAETATAEHRSQPVTASRDGSESAAVTANERKVQAFLRDVIDEHHGDHAARYLTRDIRWHGDQLNCAEIKAFGFASTMTKGLRNIRG